MKVSFTRLRRSAIAVVALALAAVGLLPAFMGTAAAYDTVTSRSVQMSSSVAGATGVSYLVTFTPVTASTIQAVAVDFCSNSPIIGDSCTAPTNLTVASTGFSGLSPAGQSAGTWTAGTTNTNRTFTLSNGSSTGTPSGAFTFTITGMVNPAFSGSCTGGTIPNCSFYARIFTFDTTADLGTWDDTANGSATATVNDAGGVALSTNAQITVTAKVQETLTFCVYTGANCAAGGAAVNLGDTNNVLSSGGQFVDITTKYDLASNAGSGVTVRMKGSLPASGANDINSIGTSATAPVNGTELFGICTYKDTGPGTLTAVAPYNHASCNAATQTAGTGSTGGVNGAQFAFDTANTTSTYGDDIATMAAADVTVGRFAFVGGSSVTTPAGIYTTNLNFIATGIY